jgi:hypothetical protein
MSDCPPTREEIREMLSDAAKRLREHHGAIASRIDCGCGDLAAQLDGLSESIVGLLEDRDRLDALEREVNSGVRGNGVAVFPYTRLNGVRHISLVELGDAKRYVVQWGPKGAREAGELAGDQGREIRGGSVLQGRSRPKREGRPGRRR